MNWLIDLDRALFIKINLDWTNRFFDWFFPLITDLNREPLALVMVLGLLVYWYWRQRQVALKWILLVVLSVGFSDLISYRVVKSMVDRNRPPYAGIEFQLRTNNHSGASFPSNHAANMFAAATVLSGGLPQLAPIFFAIAALVAYSRVYVGVHFPLDVLCGAIIGVGVALAMMRLFCRRLGLVRLPRAKPKSRALLEEE